MKNGIKTSRTFNENGYECWTVDGTTDSKMHRIDGPALIMSADIVWLVNGVRVYGWQEFQQVTQLSDEDMMVLRIKYPHFLYL